MIVSMPTRVGAFFKTNVLDKATTALKTAQERVNAVEESARDIGARLDAAQRQQRQAQQTLSIARSDLNKLQRDIETARQSKDNLAGIFIPASVRVGWRSSFLSR